VYAVAFAPDGRRLATASGDGTVRVWDVAVPAAARQRWTVSARFAAGRAVAFSGDGRWLVTGNTTTSATLWSVDGPAEPRAVIPHPGGLTGLHLSADGGRLAATFAASAARVWDLSDPGRPRSLGHAGEPRLLRAAAMFPDGRHLVTSGERVEIWDISSAPVRRSHLTAGDGPLLDVAVAPDGRTMAVGRLDGTVDLWHTLDPAGPAPRASIHAHGGWVTSVAFGGPDGRWLATASAEQVALWDLTDPAVPVGRMHAPKPVTALAFAPTGGLLAVASLDGSVQLLRPRVSPAAATPASAATAAEPTDSGPTTDSATSSGPTTGGLVVGAASDDHTAGNVGGYPANPATPVTGVEGRGPDTALPGRRGKRKTDRQGLLAGLLTIALGAALAFGPHLPPVIALVLALGLLVLLVAVVVGPSLRAQPGRPRTGWRRPAGTPAPTAQTEDGLGTDPADERLTSAGPLTGTGPLRRVSPAAGPGGIQGSGTGPLRRTSTGPIPRTSPLGGTGPLPRPGATTGPLTRPGTGPIPRTSPATGPLGKPGTGPIPRPGTNTGPIPRPGTTTGPLTRPGAGTGPIPRTSPLGGTGPLPRPGVTTGPLTRPGTGPIPRPGTNTGPIPRTSPATGPLGKPGTGPLPRTRPLPGTGPLSRSTPAAQPASGPSPARPAGVDRPETATDTQPAAPSSADASGRAPSG
jgi:WD40 repeat protein